MAWMLSLSRVAVAALGFVTLSHGAADARGSSRGQAKPGHAFAARSHARIILSGMVYRSSPSRGGALQCVPFARENSGIELAGNASNWWSAADGLYERGARPEVGSVLNFRANGRMRMGHVAVVSNVVDGRNVEIDHANWSGRGAIGRNVRVVDVSAGNDWSAVRVALSRGDYGSVYPTYGFIYDRPDRGIMVANAGTGGGAFSAGRTDALPMMAAARDLRAMGQRIQLAPTQEQEVAEAPDDYTPRRAYRSSRSRVADHRVHDQRHIRTTVASVTHRTRATHPAAPVKQRRRT